MYSSSTRTVLLSKQSTYPHFLLIPSLSSSPLALSQEWEVRAPVAGRDPPLPTGHHLAASAGHGQEETSCRHNIQVHLTAPPTLPHCLMSLSSYHFLLSIGNSAATFTVPKAPYISKYIADIQPSMQPNSSVIFFLFHNNLSLL